MGELFLSSDKRMSGVVAAHRRARARTLKFDSGKSLGRSIFVYPVVWLAELLERRALKRLFLAHPTDPEDARRKLAYLMAVMVADRASPGATQIMGAIETLRPHRATLAGYLQTRTITADD
jgi:hypothetical protein